MRRICWHMLVLLLLVSLAACATANVSGGQRAASVPASVATKADSSDMDIVPTPTPDPTATATPTPHPSPTPRARPTSSTHGGGSTLSPTSLESQLQQQLFTLINQGRADQGLYAYTLNSTMSGGAFRHSMNMASCGLSHQCPGEASPCQRVSNEGISWTSCGENVGYSSPDPTAWGGVQGIEQSMLDETPPDDGHRLNLLNASYHRVGVGIYVDSRGYVWVTEDFAS